MTRNVNIDSYGYSGYVIGFDKKRKFSIFRWWIWSKRINIWSRCEFSAHIHNKEKYILVLGWGPTQGLEHTLTAEKMYSINLQKKIKTLV